MAEPKCPSCETQGIDNIVSKESREHSRRREPWFYVVYCSQCGHIYGVFPKHLFTRGSGPHFVLPEKR